MMCDKWCSPRPLVRLGLAVVGVTFVSSAWAAEPWRFGLEQAKINAQNDWNTNPTFTEITAAGPAMAHVNANESNYSNAANQYTDPVTEKVSAWNKQKTTFVYRGKIRLIGGTTYTFGKYLDDAAIVTIGGTKVLDNGTYNNFATGSFTASATGWYDFACRVGDGTGGKGPAGGSWGTTTGLGYNTFGLTTQTEPVSDPAEGWVRLANTTDAPGALFRVLNTSDFITLGRVAATTGGYNVKVTAAMPGAAVVYSGATEGTVEDPESWGAVSAEVTFTEESLEQDVFFAWTETSRPYFAVAFQGQDETSAFLQWSDAYSLVPTPKVSAAVAAVHPTSVDLAQNLSFAISIEGEEMPDLSVTAYYGATDAGATTEGWTASKNFGVCDLGTSTVMVDGLTAGDDYVVRLCVSTGAVTVWSDPIPFSTGGAFLSAPTSLYESDTKVQKFTVSRPATSTAEDLTVYLTYSENAETLVSALPESVTIPAGSVSADVTFTMIDNATADGNAALTITIAENAAYVRGKPYEAVVSIVDDESLTAGICTWTGAAGDKKWNTPGNWDSDRVPTIVDTALFGASGIAANDTILVNGEAIIKELKYETTTAFTLAADEAGGSLQLGAITRVDVEGNEGNHTLSVPTCLYAGSETNCVWDIAGAGAFVVKTDFTKAAGTYVYKTGAGTVEMRYKNMTFAGPWIIREGTILCPEDQGHTFKGDVTVGGGENPAKLQQSKKNSIAGKTPITVLRNGTYQSGDIDNGRNETLNIHEGGLASIGSYYYMLYANFWGGTLNGGTGYNTRGISSYASDETAIFNAYWRFEGYNSYSVAVERGTAPVDLLFKNGLGEGGSGQTITKTGSGVVKSIVNFNNLKNHFKINAGTWYVDNPGEYGLGIQETTVAAGATIGGTGCVGMKDAKNTNTLALNAGTESNYATLVAGTIDTETGDHIYGTFTSGRSAAHNHLGLGAWAHVKAGIGAPVRDEETGTSVCPNDKLMVYGPLDIGANCVLDLASNSTTELKSVKSGVYTIVEAERINGQFASVILPENAKWRVNYVAEAPAEEGAEEVVTKITVTVSNGLSIHIR